MNSDCSGHMQPVAPVSATASTMLQIVEARMQAPTPFDEKEAQCLGGFHDTRRGCATSYTRTRGYVRTNGGV